MEIAILVVEERVPMREDGNVLED